MAVIVPSFLILRKLNILHERAKLMLTKQWLVGDIDPGCSLLMEGETRDSS